MATGSIMFGGYDWRLQREMDWYGTAVPVVNKSSPPVKGFNINGFFIFISRSTSEIHTWKSAKSFAKVDIYFIEMGQIERNQGQIAVFFG
jgi:hypothetical protein